MRRLLPVLLLAAASSACIVERDVVREDPAVYNAPPPAPGPDAQPDSSYQTQAEPPPPAGSAVADDETFYSGLSPYGTWAFVAPYGRVWVPAVGYGWRPYYYGRWVLTDYGWTFASDDPWGWAAYHYGRWNWATGYGWYWIPGRVWGPAWVSWRYGGGYAAWCPLGPSGVVFGYSHPAWVAVSEQHFTQPIARVAVTPHATVGVVTSAQPLSGPRASPIARGGAFGPPVASVQRAVGQPIPRVQASQVIARPQSVAQAGSSGPMRSPSQPRARAGSAGDAVRGPSAQPTSPAPRPYSSAPAPRPYTGAPRSGAVAPRRGGGRTYGGGGNGGGAPRNAPPPASAPKGSGGHPHAESKTK
jgi:hypothetical protein